MLKGLLGTYLKKCAVWPLIVATEKKEGLSLTPVQERFFAQLVNVYHKEPEVPQYQNQFLDNVKQLGSQIRSVNF